MPIGKTKGPPPKSKKFVRLDDQEGKLSANILNPGQRVSCDQYISTTLGRLANTFGKEDRNKQLAGGTIFVDHAANFIFHHHQTNLRAAETVRSKHYCESLFREYGVKIKEYIADNHPFKASEWKSDIAHQRQAMNYSGVDAHRQNLSERHIQTIFNWSRALLIHFVLHWPQQVNENLWPFAVDYVVFCWNNLPAKGIKLCPLEIFTNVLFNDHHHLQRTDVFGFPVYVLDLKLQDAKRIPKWAI